MSFDFTQIKPYKVAVQTTDFNDPQLETCDKWTQNGCCDFIEVYGALLQGRWSAKLGCKFITIGLDETLFKTGLLDNNFAKLPACIDTSLLPNACPYPITRVVVIDNALHEEVRIEGENGTIFKLVKCWNTTRITEISAKEAHPDAPLLKSLQMFKKIYQTLQSLSRKAACAQNSLSSLLPAPVARLVLAYTGYPAPKAVPNLRSKL